MNMTFKKYKKYFAMAPFLGRYLWMWLCSLSSDMSLNIVLLLEREAENISVVCERTAKLW